MKILYGKDAREKIKRGIDKCVDAVKVSMGKEGKNVLIYNGTFTEIINDGVSIAREVEVKDEIEQAGIVLAKYCAGKTNAVCGDGTTGTLVLLQSILNEVISEIQLEKPRNLRKQIFTATEKIMKKLDESSRMINGRDDIYNVALTSSLSEEIAEKITDIFVKLGKDASITLDDTERNVFEVEYVDGIQFNSINIALYSEEKEEYEDISYFVSKKEVKAKDILEKLNVLAEKGENQLVIIAPKFANEAVGLLVKLQMQGKFKVGAVQNRELNEDDLIAFGNKAKKITITKEKTTVIGGNGDIKQYVEKLKGELDKEESSFNREKIKERISYLTGGIAVVKIGKPTDVETRESFLKVEDSIHSVRWAYQDGVVKGGGLALKEASECLDESIEGERIMKVVCQSPYKQICNNAEEEIVIGENVIDSLKVIKTALQNAVSTATSILTAEAALIKENDNETEVHN